MPSKTGRSGSGDGSAVDAVAAALLLGTALGGCRARAAVELVGAWRLDRRGTLTQGVLVTEEPPEFPMEEDLRGADAQDASPATHWIVLAHDGTGNRVNARGEDEGIGAIPSPPPPGFRWRQYGRWVVVSGEDEDTFARIQGSRIHYFSPQGLRGDWVFRRDPCASLAVRRRVLDRFPQAPRSRRWTRPCCAGAAP